MGIEDVKKDLQKLTVPKDEGTRGKDVRLKDYDKSKYSGPDPKKPAIDEDVELPIDKP